MAKINIILQGFVDLNLETNENIATTIGSINQSLNTQQLELNLGSFKKPGASPTVIELPVPVEDIFESIGVSIESVQSLHIQGSRLYGVNSINSDWDLSVITTEVVGHKFKETNVNGIEFDVHLYSQEAHQVNLDKHQMRNLEILNHTSDFIIIDNKEFSVDIDNNKLVDKVKGESDVVWNQGINSLESGGDSYTALKNIWHSFRFLIFAEQILENGSITDFSAANYLYESIVNSKRTDSGYFELNFSTLRDTLKLNLDTFRDDGGLESIEFKL